MSLKGLPPGFEYGSTWHLFGTQEQNIIRTCRVQLSWICPSIKEQGSVEILTITEDGGFPQLNEMDTTEGDIADRLAGSTLAPFRYGIEENIGA